MRLHRFYIGKDFFFGTGEVSNFSSSNKELVHQLFSVFRYKISQRMIVFDGSGDEYVVEISAFDKKKVNFSVIEKKKGLVQEEVFGKKLAICFSLIKKDNIELILQKCTELGVSEFYPICTKRSEKKDFNVERGEKIIIEAAEQSGWAMLPKINKIEDIEVVIEQTKHTRQIVFHADDLKQTTKHEGDAILFIGPEGGWTDGEIQLFRANKFEFQSLGVQVLRAETAAILAAGRFL